jgi:DNA-binding response OmpR family regulator
MRPTNPPKVRRVLIYDEDASRREAARRRFPSEKYRVVEADGFAGALRLAKTRVPDLVVMGLRAGLSPRDKQFLEILPAGEDGFPVPVVGMLDKESPEALAAARALRVAATVPWERLDDLLAAAELAVLGRRAAPEGPLDVLHVEDDDSYAGLVKEWVGGLGLKLQRLSSGAELTSYLANCLILPLCLLLDLTLLDADGLALCEKVKKSPATQAVPIVLLTGREIPLRECLERHALYRVIKGPDTERELRAALTAIMAQHRRSRGILEVGDLQLDAGTGGVRLEGAPILRAAPGQFAALSLLVQSSPWPVPDERLYPAFLARGAYHSLDHELSVHQTVRTYVSRLRRDLGAALGERIVRVKEDGYAYIPRLPKPPPIVRSS